VVNMPPVESSIQLLYVLVPPSKLCAGVIASPARAAGAPKTIKDTPTRYRPKPGFRPPTRSDFDFRYFVFIGFRGVD